MITIEHPARDLPEKRYYDRQKREFITLPAQHLEPMRLQLEHSLMSMRRFEAETHKPFEGTERMSQEDLLAYIRCMTVNTQKSDAVYKQLSLKDLEKIVNYMVDTHSAWDIKPVRNPKGSGRRRPNTVEGIYYAMIQYGIPMECEKWHLNSLMALIDYFYRQGGGSGGKSRSQKEMNEFYRSLNEANRKKYNSKG